MNLIRIFTIKDSGIATHRDIWVNNFSKNIIEKNVKYMIATYNHDVEKLSKIDEKLTHKTIEPYITLDDSKISWSVDMKRKAARLEKIEYDKNSIVPIMYRPFVKKYVYRNSDLNYTTYKSFKTLPDSAYKNNFINIAGISSKDDFSLLMTDTVNDYMIFTNSRNFPRYMYESDNLFNEKIDNIASDEDFYFIYGVLHSSSYREKYENDLKKGLPRIPKVKNREKYIEIGRKLANLHLDYEKAPFWESVKVNVNDEVNPNYKVTQMKHPKIINREGKKSK